MSHPLRATLAIMASVLLLASCGEQAGSDENPSAAPQTVPNTEPPPVPTATGTGLGGLGADSLNAASSRAGTQGQDAEGSRQRQP